MGKEGPRAQILDPQLEKKKSARSPTRSTPTPREQPAKCCGLSRLAWNQSRLSARSLPNALNALAFKQPCEKALQIGRDGSE